MKMEPLPGGHLKIWMTHADMRHWGLTFEAIDAHDPATRRAIFKLLKIAEQQYGFHSNGRLTAEVLSFGNGCLLLLTSGEHAFPLPAASPSVYTVRNADDLLRLGENLSDAPRTPLPTASLFAWRREYRLILYADIPLSDSCRRILAEFAEPVADGAAIAAYTEEHGRALAIGNALQQLITARGFPEPTPPEPVR